MNLSLDSIVDAAREKSQAPDPDGSLEAGDELLFVTAQADEEELANVLSPREGAVKDVSAATPRMVTPGL